MENCPICHGDITSILPHGFEVGLWDTDLADEVQLTAELFRTEVSTALEPILVDGLCDCPHCEKELFVSFDWDSTQGAHNVTVEPSVVEVE